MAKKKRPTALLVAKLEAEVAAGRNRETHQAERINELNGIVVSLRESWAIARSRVEARPGFRWQAPDKLVAVEMPDESTRDAMKMETWRAAYLEAVASLNVQLAAPEPAKVQLVMAGVNITVTSADRNPVV